jgi:hypothetical protein
MGHQVTIDNTGEVFRCGADVHVLAAMELARCHGIPVGCRNVVAGPARCASPAAASRPER